MILNAAKEDELFCDLGLFSWDKHFNPFIFFW